MRVGEIAERLDLEIVCGDPNVEVHRGCVGDLLSEVMRTCRSDSIWVTVQSHVNIVAVAIVVGIKAIVLCNGHGYEKNTVEKAEKEGIVLLRTDDDPFDVAGRLYSILEGR